MPSTKSYISFLFTLLAIVWGVLIAANTLRAQWSSPTAIPPGNNPASFLTTGINSESKSGVLTLTNNFYVIGSGLVGKVGIGTSTIESSSRLVVEPYTNASIDAGAGSIRTSWQAAHNDDVINKSYLTSTLNASIDSIKYWTLSGNNLYASSTAYNIAIGTTTAGTAKLAVIGGNVGIGTTSPSQKLDVAGRVAANAYRFNASTKYSTEQSALVYTDQKINLVFNNTFSVGENLYAGTIKIVARKRDGNGAPNGVLEKNFVFHVLSGAVSGLESSVASVSGAMSNVRIGEPFVDTDMQLKIPIHSTGMGSGRIVTFEVTIEGSTNWVSKLSSFSFDTSIADAFPGPSYPTVPSRFGVGLGNNVMPSQALQVIGNALFSGNVGIGTTTPTVSLQVNGYAIANTPTHVSHLATKGYVDTAAQSLWVRSGNHLYASSSSWRVGIGTTSPASALHIYPQTGIEGLRIVSSDFSPLVIRKTDNSDDLFRVNQFGDVTAVTSSATRMRSNNYCDASGNNCFNPSSGWSTEITTIFLTSTTINGNFVFTGGFVGYDAGNKICNSQQAGSHFCRTDEIMYLIQKNGASSFSSINGQDAWIADGPPGFTGAVAADDCSGWTNGTTSYLGHFWIFNSSGGGKGALINCATKKKIACCK